jgi:hypothetical protein
MAADRCPCTDPCWLTPREAEVLKSSVPGSSRVSACLRRKHQAGSQGRVEPEPSRGDDVRPRHIDGIALEGRPGDRLPELEDEPDAGRIS